MQGGDIRSKRSDPNFRVKSVELWKSKEIYYYDTMKKIKYLERENFVSINKILINMINNMKNI